MGTLTLLSGAELARLVPFGDYVDAVADAFRLHAEGRTTAPTPMHIAVDGGGFHVKAARAPLGRDYVAFKVNGNFPGNRMRHGLPTIQGAVLLCDAANGTPLALLDSAEITSKRTAAATAVAARYLARPSSATVTICGCGEQGLVQLLSLHHGFRLARVFAWDVDAKVAEDYATRMTRSLGIAVEPSRALRPATLQSDIVATCTTAREPYLGIDDVRAGTFIAAVGADHPEKSEIMPALMAKATVVADVHAQCIVMGDLHHAVAAGAMSAEGIHAELGELVLGRKPGRTRDDEITIFDGTGTGIQDVAAAARAYELACRGGYGTTFEMA